MTIQNYSDLFAWQRAMDFIESVYRVTRTWPKDEAYGLTSQVHRAAVSVAANIAEGQGRGSDKEFLRFLAIAHGSLREAETHLLIGLRLRYYDESVCTPAMEQAAEVGRLIQGLARKIRQP
ncbi:MAG: four helix bundle protein [Chloroflexota bacterium]|nr:four helix bundle protein [Chloroflexota bacterium]